MKPEIIYLLIGTGGSITPYGNIKTLLESICMMTDKHYKFVRGAIRENGQVGIVSEENGDRYKILATAVIRAPYKKV